MQPVASALCLAGSLLFAFSDGGPGDKYWRFLFPGQVIGTAGGMIVFVGMKYVHPSSQDDVKLNKQFTLAHPSSKRFPSNSQASAVHLPTSSSKSVVSSVSPSKTGSLVPVSTQRRPGPGQGTRISLRAVTSWRPGWCLWCGTGKN